MNAIMKIIFKFLVPRLMAYAIAQMTSANIKGWLALGAEAINLEINARFDRLVADGVSPEIEDIRTLALESVDAAMASNDMLLLVENGISAFNNAS